VRILIGSSLCHSQYLIPNTRITPSNRLRLTPRSSYTHQLSSSESMLYMQLKRQRKINLRCHWQICWLWSTPFPSKCKASFSFTPRPLYTCSCEVIKYSVYMLLLTSIIVLSTPSRKRSESLVIFTNLLSESDVITVCNAPCRTQQLDQNTPQPPDETNRHCLENWYTQIPMFCRFPAEMTLTSGID
jgi:hypothetical protein